MHNMGQQCRSCIGPEAHHTMCHPNATRCGFVASVSSAVTKPLCKQTRRVEAVCYDIASHHVKSTVTAG